MTATYFHYLDHLGGVHSKLTWRGKTWLLLIFIIFITLENKLLIDASNSSLPLPGAALKQKHILSITESPIYIHITAYDARCLSLCLCSFVHYKMSFCFGSSEEKFWIISTQWARQFLRITAQRLSITIFQALKLYLSDSDLDRTINFIKYSNAYK